MLQNIARIVYLLIALSAVVVQAAIVAYGVCTNPHQERGICVQIKDCDYLLEVLTTTDLADQDRDFLQGSQCGVDSSQMVASQQILICCPDRYRNSTNNITANTTTNITTNITTNTTTNAIITTMPLGNVLPVPGECGKILSNRIYGGNITEIDEFPWMALIRYKTGPDRFGFYCGGSLINTRYVLTAGHCLRHPDMPASWELYSVRLGEWDLTTDPDCIVDTRGRRDCFDGYRDILIDYAIPHPRYVAASQNQFNDIALIRLAESVPTSSNIIPICLPLARDIRDKEFTSTVMDVAGWGVTENGTASLVKLKIMVNIWNITRCQNTYRTFQMEIDGISQMCAGGESGIDTCRGDSGGPLMATESINKRNVYYAIGVVSYGPRPCGLDGWPGVYSRVGNFTDWIVSTLLP